MSSLLCLTFTLREMPTPSSEAFGRANATIDHSILNMSVEIKEVEVPNSLYINVIDMPGLSRLAVSGMGAELGKFRSKFHIS